MIDFDDFMKIDIRIGTVIDAKDFLNAKRPAYQLWIDFGATLGMRKTSAQITQNYAKEELIGKQVAAVVNFPPKQIANFMSEVLILGFPDDQDNVTLISPTKPVPNGGRLY